jgi:hypothetical protein
LACSKKEEISPQRAQRRKEERRKMQMEKIKSHFLFSLGLFSAFSAFSAVKSCLRSLRLVAIVQKEWSYGKR